MQKIALITGGTDGIGKQTALGLLKEKFKVVIVGRDEQKAKNAISELIEKSANTQVEFLIADFASQAQIIQLAKQFKEKYNKLDVLVNNAASVTSERLLTEDGFERQLAINHLAYFLLTHQLLDVLLAAPNARIVNVASGAHYGGKVVIDNLNSDKGNYQGFAVYSNTKLYNVLFTYELAERLKSKGITVNCLHPGVVQTNLANKETKTFLSVVWSIFKSFGIKAEQGAQTSIFLASSDEVKDITGQYFEKCKPKKPKKDAFDINLRKALWEQSEKMCKINYQI
jgi:NAD(P)-dependent dehydrogenase (short-subunit alcohol dehydrogenase family)